MLLIANFNPDLTQPHLLNLSSTIAAELGENEAETFLVSVLPNPGNIQVLDALVRGKLVIFLGSDINLCGRKEAFQPGQHLPSKAELATYLAKTLSDSPTNLANLGQVSQYVDVERGQVELYEKL